VYSKEEGRAWADARHLPYLETSGKENINVLEAFEGK